MFLGIKLETWLTIIAIAVTMIASFIAIATSTCKNDQRWKLNQWGWLLTALTFVGGATAVTLAIRNEENVAPVPKVDAEASPATIMQPGRTDSSSGAFYLEIAASGRDSSPKAIQEGTFSPGHAFMIITVPTNHGPKEEAFGFYPRTENPLLVFVGTPGLLKSEFRQEPDISLIRMSKVSESIKRSITAEDRRNIYSLTDAWNSREYKFLTTNCIDFVDRTARAVHWRVPPRSPLQQPGEYVSKLKEMNDAPPDEYSLRVYNVDDRVTVYVNGTLIRTVNYMQDTGQFKLSLHSGDNSLELHLLNLVPNSAVSYGYQIRKNGSLITADSCTGCYNHKLFPVIEVWKKDFTLHVEGAQQ
jgi:hypothetical protein